MKLFANEHHRHKTRSFAQEARRAEERVEEARIRIDAGRQTLAALLQGGDAATRVAEETAGGPAVGKLTQTLVRLAPMLRVHRDEVTAVIGELDRARSVLGTERALGAIAAPVERAVGRLLDRAGVDPRAMPRDLLGDLAADEAAPPRARGDIAPRPEREPPPRPSTNPVLARATQRLGEVTPQRRVANVEQRPGEPQAPVRDVARSSGWLALFRNVATPLASTAATPATVDVVRPSAVTHEGTALAHEVNDAVTPAPLAHDATHEATHDAKNAATALPTRAPAPPHRSEGAPPTTRRAQPHADVSPAAAPRTRVATGPHTPATEVPAHVGRWSLPAVATQALAEPARRSLDIDEPVAAPAPPAMQVTAVTVDVRVPPLTAREARVRANVPAPLPRAVPRLDLGRALDAIATDHAKHTSEAGQAATVAARQVGEDATHAVSGTLRDDRDRAQQLTTLANRPSPALRRRAPRPTAPTAQATAPIATTTAQIATTPTATTHTTATQTTTTTPTITPTTAPATTIATAPTPAPTAPPTTNLETEPTPTASRRAAPRPADTRTAREPRALGPAADPAVPTRPALVLRPAGPPAPRASLRPIPAPAKRIVDVVRVEPRSTAPGLPPKLNLTSPWTKPPAPLPASFARAVADDRRQVEAIERRVAATPAAVDELEAARRDLARAGSTHDRRAKQQSAHQATRKQAGAQRARQGRAKVDARAAEQRKRQRSYADRARQQLIAELNQHATLALSLLDMTKEQRIAALQARLAAQKPEIRKRIDAAKEEARARWTTDKAQLAKAHTEATHKIDADCDRERKTTIAGFETIRRQLQTNPEQAAVTALALSKQDQARYASTKQSVVSRIQSNAAARLSGLEGRRQVMAAKANARGEDGQPTAEATAAKQAVDQLVGQIADVKRQRDVDVQTETARYDGLIERRRQSGETAAQQIRRDARAYLASLGQMQQAMLDEVEQLRSEGKRLARQRLDHDVARIERELTEELRLLDMRFEHESIEAEQSIELVAKEQHELTEADKQKARVEITRQRDAGIAKIKRARADQLGAIGAQVDATHAAIGDSLAGLGQATQLATRQIATLQASFDRRIDQARQHLERKASEAIAHQRRAADATAASLRGLRSRRYDDPRAASRQDAARPLADERAAFDAQRKQEEAYDRQRQAEMDRLKTRDDPTGQRNVKPEQVWNEKTRQEKAQQLTQALSGTLGDYNAVRLALATMTVAQLKELLAANPDVARLLRSANAMDGACIQQVLNASTDAELRGALLNWSTNGAVGNDKDANNLSRALNPLGHLWFSAGYDKAAMEAMFASMSPAEKAALDHLYREKYGMSVEDEIRDEAYSVANRDALLAKWTTDPAERLRLEAQNAQLSGTTGNVLGLVRNASYLFGYEISNQTAMNIVAAPQDLVAYGLSKVTGDGGWSRQQALLKQQTLDMLVDPDALMTAQKTYLKAMEPLPTDSPIERLRKQQKYKEVHDTLRVDGRSLEQLDELAANNAWQQAFGGNREMSAAFKALREGNEEEFLRQRMLAGFKQSQGSETWIKEGLEDAARRGKIGELKALLAKSGTSYEQLVEARFGGWLGNPIDVTYFKVLGEAPADPAKDPDGYARQTAAKLAYYQLGGLTGFGNDLAAIEREMANLPAGLKDQLQAHYAEIVKSKSLMAAYLPTWAQYATNPFGNWSTGNVFDDLELTYGGQWNRWTGGAIGKGTAYERLQYDIAHGKAETPEAQYRRALARYQIDMANTSGMSEVAIDNARRELERLKRAYEALPPELRTATPDALAPSQRDQLAELSLRIATASGWQDTANATQTSYVETVGWIVGTTVSTVIIIAGTAVTGGAAAAVLVPIAAAVIGGLSAIGVKRVMLGDKYGGAQFQQDLGALVIDAVAAGAIGAGQFNQVATRLVTRLGLAGPVAQAVLRELLENAAQIPGGLGKALLNPELWKGDSAEVLRKLRGLVATETVKALANTAVTTGTRAAIRVPLDGSDASVLQSALVAAMSSGASAAVEIDPSRPLGDQVLAVIKASAVAGATAAGTAAVRRPASAELAVRPPDAVAPSRPSATAIEVRADGTIVVPRARSRQLLADLKRAAAAKGLAIAFAPRPTVDADGRRVIEVTLSDGTRTRIAIDDAPMGRTATRTNEGDERDANRPKLLGDGDNPKLLGDGSAPKLLGDGSAPKLLGDGNGPKLLGDGNGPKLLGDGNGPGLDADGVVATANRLYRHFDTDEGDAALKAVVQQSGTAPATPELAYTCVGTDAFAKIASGGRIQAAAAFGAQGANADKIWFSAARPFYAGDIAFVLPREELIALGGQDSRGLANQDNVMTVDHASRPEGLPIEHMAVVYSVGNGYVVPLYLPPGWKHPFPNQLPADVPPREREEQT